jgi:cold shock CspA family protein
MFFPEVNSVELPDLTLTGCVKFFKKTDGYGFITVLKNDKLPEFSEKDIFVHFSEIKIENSQYKYLLKGEYVEFKIGPSNKTNITNEMEKYTATNITGIQGGKLMCETNYEEFIPNSTKSSHKMHKDYDVLNTSSNHIPPVKKTYNKINNESNKSSQSYNKIKKL